MKDYSEIIFKLIEKHYQDKNSQDLCQNSCLNTDLSSLNVPDILEQYKFEDYYENQQQLQLDDILLQIDSLSPLIKVEKLRQWQKQVLQDNLTADDNLLILAGTASGKTHVSIIFALYTLLVEKKCVIFSAPFVTIVNELVNTFSQFLTGNQGLCGLSGLRSIPEFIASKPTVYVCTNEKAFQLLKKFNEQNLQDKLGLLVIDELQIVGETNSERSVVLETFINYFLLYQLQFQTKLITMSATLSNHEDISQWLCCKTFQTEYTEQKLQKYIIHDNSIYDFDTLNRISEFKFKYNQQANIQIKIAIMAPKPLLYFVSTRNQCVYQAGQLSQYLIKNFAEKINKDEDKVIGRKNLLQQLEQKQQSVLAGVAYHNASLSGLDRMKIEDSYLEGILHTIIATSTLAAGVNLPAKSIFINQLKIGIQQLDSIRFKQMTGRAGRFDGNQNGIVFIVSDDVFTEIKYVKADFQCKSNLLEPQYRNNSINSLLMNAFTFQKDFQFGLKRTLFYIQNNTTNADCLENINFLIKIKFLSLNEGSLALTNLGHSANESQLSPYQAYYFDLLFEQIKKYGINPFDTVSILLFSYSPEPDILHLLSNSTFQSFLDFELPQYQTQINIEDIISQDSILLKILQISNSSKKLIKNIILQNIINIERALVNSSEVRLKSPATTLLSVRQFAELRQFPIYSLFEQMLCQIRSKIQDDITELLEIPRVGNKRALILKQSGYNNYHDIISFGLDKLKLKCNFGQLSNQISQLVYNECEKMGFK